MCEIVVVAVGDASRERYQEGDVIECLPDGSNWGKLVVSNPNWKIIKFPGVSTDAFRGMLTNGLTKLGAVDTKRAVTFDYKAAQLQMSSKTLLTSDIQALTLTKTAVDLANTLGGEVAPNVIG